MPSRPLSGHKAKLNSLKAGNWQASFGSQPTTDQTAKKKGDLSRPFRFAQIPTPR